MLLFEPETLHYIVVVALVQRLSRLSPNMASLIAGLPNASSCRQPLTILVAAMTHDNTLLILKKEIQLSAFEK